MFNKLFKCISNTDTLFLFLIKIVCFTIMKNLTERLINESTLELGGKHLSINIIVTPDKDSDKYEVYNLIGLNNAIKSAYKYKWDIFFEVTNGDKVVTSQSIKEAIAEASK